MYHGLGGSEYPAAYAGYVAEQGQGMGISPGQHSESTEILYPVRGACGGMWGGGPYEGFPLEVGSGGDLLGGLASAAARPLSLGGAPLQAPLPPSGSPGSLMAGMAGTAYNDGTGNVNSPLFASTPIRPTLSYRTDGTPIVEIPDERENQSPVPKGQSAGGFYAHQASRPDFKSPVPSGIGPTAGMFAEGIDETLVISKNDLVKLKDQLKGLKKELASEKEENSLNKRRLDVLKDDVGSLMDSLKEEREKSRELAKNHEIEKTNVNYLTHSINKQKEELEKQHQSNMAKELQRVVDYYERSNMNRDAAFRKEIQAQHSETSFTNQQIQKLVAEFELLAKKCEQETAAKDAVQRELLGFKASFYRQMSEKDQEIESLKKHVSSRDATVEFKAKEFNLSKPNEFLSPRVSPVTSGTTTKKEGSNDAEPPPERETRGSGVGGLPDGHDELREKVKAILNENKVVDEPKYPPPIAPVQTAPDNYSAGPIHDVEFTKMIKGVIHRPKKVSLDFFNEDEDYVRGGAPANTSLRESGTGGGGGGGPNGGSQNREIPGPSPPQREEGGTGAGGAPGGGDGGGSGAAAVDIGRHHGAASLASLKPKVNDFTLDSLPTSSNLVPWFISTSTKIGNCYPDNPVGVQKHIYGITGMKSMEDVDAYPNVFPLLEAKANNVIRTTIEKYGDIELKSRVQDETRETFLPNAPRDRLRMEHMLWMIYDYNLSQDAGQAWQDQFELFHTMPKTRDGVEKADWLEIEHWIRRWDRVMKRMKKIPDADTLYTFFVKEAKLSKMKILQLIYHDHSKLEVHERTYEDIKNRIDRFIRERRQERNNLQAQHQVQEGIRVPGVPGLMNIVGDDGALLPDGDAAPDGQAVTAAPARRARSSDRSHRSRSTSRRSAFARNRSWRSPGGNVHSPSGYRYSRNRSRTSPGGRTRQRPRGFSKGGRARYSRSPLNSRHGRRFKGRRSSNYSSKSPSGDRDNPALPVLTEDGKPVPFGICKFAFQGKKCPHKDRPGGCSFKPCNGQGEIPKGVPAPVDESVPSAPAVAGNQETRSANSPRGGTVEIRDD